MTDRELDKAIGTTLGDRAEIAYAASQDGGKSLAIWTDDIVRKADIEKYCQAHPEYRLEKLERWPRYSSLAEFSQVLRDEMRQRGWSYKFEHSVAGKYSVPTMITDPKAVFDGDMEPFTAVGIDEGEFRAIAIAAAKALGVWSE